MRYNNTNEHSTNFSRDNKLIYELLIKLTDLVTDLHVSKWKLTNYFNFSLIDNAKDVDLSNINSKSFIHNLKLPL